MTLLDRLRILKEIINLEFDNKIKNIKLTISSNYIHLDYYDPIPKESFLNEYINTVSLNSSICFKDSILFCDAVQNFQSYSRSKRSIKKFNL